jgi:hypothetical protein
MGRDLNFLKFWHFKNNIFFAKPEKVLQYIICNIVKKIIFKEQIFLKENKYSFEIFFFAIESSKII